MAPTEKALATGRCLVISMSSKLLYVSEKCTAMESEDCTSEDKAASWFLPFYRLLDRRQR